MENHRLLGEKRHNLKIIYFVLLCICLFLLIFFFYSTNRLDNVEIQPGRLPELGPLGSRYKRKLFNLDFEYITTPRICNSSLLAVIIVTSYFGNVETRSAMRRSFSSEDLQKLGVRRVFLLGLAPSNKYTKQEQILDENKRFEDILQGNFVEAYRNLTYKHIMGHKWASESCNKAKYVIKMDDDIVINVVDVVDLLKTIKLPGNLMAGYIMRKMAPIREPANKWFVTEDEYVQNSYPTFISGWFYITTPKISSKLFLLSHYFQYFWIDDVYVTGVLAQRLNIKHYDLGKYFTVHPEFLECCINDVISKNLYCEILVGPNGGDNDLFYKFNEMMRKCKGGKCAKRGRSLNETCVAERKIPLGRGVALIEDYKLH